MAKTTCIQFDRIYDDTRIFWTIGNNSVERLTVENFEDGIVTVTPLACNFNDFVETVSGCFNDDSNFGTEVLRAYNCNENDTFKGIKFEFNGITLTVTKENADVERIYQDWNAIVNAITKKRRLEREAWLKTPEGQECIAQQEAEEARKKSVLAEVLRIDDTTELDFKDQEGEKIWNQFVKENSKDPYSCGIVNYSRRWAKYMQALIAKGKTVDKIAKESSYDCNVNGISYFAYGFAVNILSQCWKHGDELLEWYNKNHKTDKKLS